MNDVFDGRSAGLLLIVFSVNTSYLYRSIIAPLREIEALYLRFNRGYDSKAIFSKPVFFTSAEKQSLAKIGHLLDNQVNRLSNRQAQYLALQNQINPHFLYNTLEADSRRCAVGGNAGYRDDHRGLCHLLPLHDLEHGQPGVA